jgi:hypothetical protein
VFLKKIYDRSKEMNDLICIDFPQITSFSPQTCHNFRSIDQIFYGILNAFGRSQECQLDSIKHDVDIMSNYYIYIPQNFTFFNHAELQRTNFQDPFRKTIPAGIAGM